MRIPRWGPSAADRDLAAAVLAARLALDPEHPEAALERSHRAARDFGMALGAEARRRAGTHPPNARLRMVLSTVLEERGFDPRPDESGAFHLRNCPFDALSADYRELVCPLNLSMMHGVLEGLGAGDLEAVLEPQPGMCCVAFKPATGGRTAG